jgi:hypothetical protein
MYSIVVCGTKLYFCVCMRTSRLDMFCLYKQYHWYGLNNMIFGISLVMSAWSWLRGLSSSCQNEESERKCFCSQCILHFACCKQHKIIRCNISNVKNTSWNDTVFVSCYAEMDTSSYGHIYFQCLRCHLFMLWCMNDDVVGH